MAPATTCYWFVDVVKIVADDGKALYRERESFFFFFKSEFPIFKPETVAISLSKPPDSLEEKK